MGSSKPSPLMSPAEATLGASQSLSQPPVSLNPADPSRDVDRAERAGMAEDHIGADIAEDAAARMAGAEHDVVETVAVDVAGRRNALANAKIALDDETRGARVGKIDDMENPPAWPNTT